MTELAQSLRNRVYYAARDGMAITLYALLNDKSDEEVHELLNQVKVWVTMTLHCRMKILANTPIAVTRMFINIRGEVTVLGSCD